MNHHLRILYIAYFVTHIPITILIDLQGLFSTSYPQILSSILDWYIISFKDPLMRETPTWFRSFLLCELCVQLPFFPVAIYGLIYQKNWIRIPLIIYGTHTATTVFPILSEICLSGALRQAEKITLSLIYLPYFLIPLLLVISGSRNVILFSPKKKD